MGVRRRSPSCTSRLDEGSERGAPGGLAPRREGSDFFLMRFSARCSRLLLTTRSPPTVLGCPRGSLPAALHPFLVDNLSSCRLVSFIRLFHHSVCHVATRLGGYCTPDPLAGLGTQDPSLPRAHAGVRETSPWHHEDP